MPTSLAVRVLVRELLLSVFLVQLIALGFIYPYINRDMASEERTAIKVGIAVAVLLLLVVLWSIGDYFLRNSPVFR